MFQRDGQQENGPKAPAFEGGSDRILRIALVLLHQKDLVLDLCAWFIVRPRSQTPHPVAHRPFRCAR